MHVCRGVCTLIRIIKHVLLKHGVRSENGKLSTSLQEVLICMGDVVTNWKVLKKHTEITLQ